MACEYDHDRYDHDVEKCVNATVITFLGRSPIVQIERYLPKL